MKRITEIISGAWRGEQGITGLETAIVLIAFVVVSSVFAFAALSTGLFSADRSKDTIQAGLSEARGTLEIKGGIKANATLTTKSLTTVTGGNIGTGDGSNTIFSLIEPVLSNSESIYVAGASKVRNVDYTINFTSGAVTFTGAPANGAAVTADYKHGSEIVGTGNGSNTSFTLANSPIIPGTVVMYSNGTAQSLGTNFDVNYRTGVVTLTAAPASGVRVDATYTAYIVSQVKLTLANAAGGKPVDITPGHMVVGYMDSDTLSDNIGNFTLNRLGNANANNLLEAGEMIEVGGDVSGFGRARLDEFVVQLKPQSGAVMTIARTIPGGITSVMNLN